MADNTDGPVPKGGGRGKGFVRGFQSFIRDYGVLPLAIGVVIGSAVNDLVKSLVDGLISPFVALLSPQGKLQSLQVVFHGSIFKIGQVINSTLSFIFVALIVYIGVKFILRKDDLLIKK